LLAAEATCSFKVFYINIVEKSNDLFYVIAGKCNNSGIHENNPPFYRYAFILWQILCAIKTNKIFPVAN